MTFLTDQMIADAMNELGVQFDCHSLQKRCTRRYAVEVADEIKRQHATGDPLLHFSAVFSKYVDTAFRGQIVKTAKVESENLGGETSTNQQWRKLVAVIVPPARLAVARLRSSEFSRRNRATSSRKPTTSVRMLATP